MEIHKAFKVELDPNNLQRTFLVQHAGVARWAFNWGLERKKKAFDLHEKIVEAGTDQKKSFMSIGELINIVTSGWLASGTSYFLCMLLNDDGLKIQAKENKNV